MDGGNPMFSKFPVLFHLHQVMVHVKTPLSIISLLILIDLSKKGLVSARTVFFFTVWNSPGKAVKLDLINAFSLKKGKKTHYTF